MRKDALHIRVDAFFDLVDMLYIDYAVDDGSLDFEDWIKHLTFVCDGGNFAFSFSESKSSYRGCLDENGFVVLPDVSDDIR